MSSTCWKIYADTGGTFTDVLAYPPGTKWNSNPGRLKVLSTGAVRATVISSQSSKLQVRFNPQASGLPHEFWSGCALKMSSIHPSGQDTDQVFTILDSQGGWVELDRVADPCHEGDIVEFISVDTAPVLAARILTATPHGSPLPKIDFVIATTLATNALLEGKTPPVTLFINAGFEDVLSIHNQQRQSLFELKPTRSTFRPQFVVPIETRANVCGEDIHPLCLTGDVIYGWRKFLPQSQNAAVCLIHSDKNPESENRISQVLIENGFCAVTASNELWAFPGLLERAETTVVHAALKPIMEDYLGAIERSGPDVRIHVMTSSGSLRPRHKFLAKDSLLSGPAGGVIGVGHISRQCQSPRVIGLDMGGTSTDVCRYEGGPTLRFEHRVGNARIAGPSVEIETVAAGGGSICGFRDSRIFVGPESAGSRPGPACYGYGGPLTLTDVNLLLNRMSAEQFGIPIIREHSETALKQVLDSIEASGQPVPSRAALLQGFLDMANELMTEAIRTISVREGYDPADHALITFGGAGGQHGCDIAGKLNIRTVLCPAHAGILSAVGLASALHQSIQGAPCRCRIRGGDIPSLVEECLRRLENCALDDLLDQGFPKSGLTIQKRMAEIRFVGQSHAEVVEFETADSILKHFESQYLNVFGYLPESSEVEMLTLRVIASTRSEDPIRETFVDPDGTGIIISGCAGEDRPVLIDRQNLQCGQLITGPAVVQDTMSTIWVPHAWIATVGSLETIRLTPKALDSDDGAGIQTAAKEISVIDVEIAANRLSAIARQMGEALKRTAMSTNVKDRMDFSCAVLTPEGMLAANAPHIPVHLGAMGFALREVLKIIQPEPGDVLICNHPAYGGSHLPDITVIQPIFDTGSQLLGFTANRAHHAEIGGTRAGSMPPDATCLEEEGVVIKPTWLIKKGCSQWKHIKELLENARWPSRRVQENLADLKAQVAACRMGEKALLALAAETGEERVRTLMRATVQHAENLVTRHIEKHEGFESSGIQALDDGSRIALRVSIHDGWIHFDFTGTSPTHPRNLNATPGIVHSALVYCLRVWIGQRLPLNDGLLNRTRITLPDCFLNPTFPEEASRCPAVAAGNTESSQNIVEAFMKATQLMASSQGTMNNVIFGNDRFSFYETLGGGTGAGPGFHGTDAIHSHMTNTAITDPEILEYNFPVILRRWGIAPHTGGLGQWNGGHGMIREIQFQEAVQVNLITHHRTSGPMGLKGGLPGSPGAQTISRSLDDGSCQTTRLPHIAQFDAKPGDILSISTPGGGAYLPQP